MTYALIDETTDECEWEFFIASDGTCPKSGTKALVNTADIFDASYVASHSRAYRRASASGEIFSKLGGLRGLGGSPSRPAKARRTGISYKPP